MKAWILKAHGDPHTVLELRDHPTPQPQAHEVLIRCEGFGLNYADVMAVKGLYREAPPLPSILGYEVVGTVEAVGTAVPNDLIGERVVAMTRFGGYAQYAVTDHRALAVIPESLALGEAAAMATQGCTAWYAARILCPLRRGQRVLIHSAAGGVGQWLVQLALLSGCEVFAIASGKAKCEHLATLGAQHVIDRSAGDPYAALRHALGGGHLDVSLLFSTLRGFQAHAQRFGEISLTIDTAVGFNDQTISCYADRYGVDEVILASQLSEFEV